MEEAKLIALIMPINHLGNLGKKTPERCVWNAYTVFKDYLTNCKVQRPLRASCNCAKWSSLRPLSLHGTWQFYLFIDPSRSSRELCIKRFRRVERVDLTWQINYMQGIWSPKFWLIGAHSGARVDRTTAKFKLLSILVYLRKGHLEHHSALIWFIVHADNRDWICKGSSTSGH